MKALRVIILAAAGTLALNAVAHGATLYTPILPSAGWPTIHDCEYLNVSSKTPVITIGIIDYQGNAEFEQTVGVGPGTGGGIASAGLAQAYCRVTFTGSKNQIRASLCVREAGANICQAVVEAR